MFLRYSVWYDTRYMGLPARLIVSRISHDMTLSVLTVYGSAFACANSRRSLSLGSTNSVRHDSQYRAAISFSAPHSSHVLNVQRYPHWYIWPFAIYVFWHRLPWCAGMYPYSVSI